MGLVFRFALIALFVFSVAALVMRHPAALESPEAAIGLALLGVLLLAALLENGRARTLLRQQEQDKRRERQALRDPERAAEAIVQAPRNGALLRRGFVALRTIALNLAIWCATVAGFAAAYSNRSEIRETALMAYSALKPGEPVALSPVEAVLTRDGGGHFTTVVQVNGEPVRMLVDTGSSDVALPYEEAERLGVDLDDLRFTREVMTANGHAKVAPTALAEITIGPITLRDVPASVAEPGRLGSPLLGMSFLGELSEVSIRGDKLRLKR